MVSRFLGCNGYLVFVVFSTAVGRYFLSAGICCVKAIDAKCLKIRRKSLVSSDFMCIFARFLCALRPRAYTRDDGGLGRKVLKVSLFRMQ